ncbi:tetratricopeptide repeat protein [Streptomyces sp. NBC_01381]|uniref:ATP-binding protein n=1 Tax=Streptomyces sp. NBC_01381 TaxID=2903845 RepID=UPI0022580100|nr:ATP-binding protein [Streptomyces sp. NBC_01381]MCX4666366.1 tetratricopeptide repeat protein [Streptomyces sp. NBC_01381]
MAPSADSEQPSMQDLIRRRRRAGFVGRRGEIEAFRANFDVSPGDERHSFLFHIHGIGGVGKTSLVRELEQLARERGALTAYVDEAVGSVPEAMVVISAQFALQKRRLKTIDRLLATYRERRHEAESASVATLDQEQDPGRAAPPPSPGSMAVSRAALVGLGLAAPGMGAFAGAVDPTQLAQGADKVRARLGARFSSQDDVQLVMSPEQVLTPVLLNELADLSKSAPWIVLFFDTYERTAPFLDGWLYEVMLTDRHGALPATVVVVTAGQHAFDTARWGGYGDFVTHVPLDPFTDLEARGLLAAKGVVAEPVVEEVLRLSGGLPVLVSTLAEARPADPDDVGDPSATAVERFLKWERDPVRRAVALACALPRRIDADVFRAAVDGVCAEAEVGGLLGWLRGLPFVSYRGDRVQYHAVVRAPMLRLQRNGAPRQWVGQHRRLAETFGGWREEAEAGLHPEKLWSDEPWRDLRLAESYHLLCAGERMALPVVLRDAANACDSGEVVARRWAQALVDAGEDAQAEAAARWGHDLLDALADGAGLAAALRLLIDRGGFDQRGRAFALMVRAGDLRDSWAFADAQAEYDRAIALDPELERAHYGKALTYMCMDEPDSALPCMDRAEALGPDSARNHAVRGDAYRRLGRYEEAVRELDRALELDPVNAEVLVDRGVSRHEMGQRDEALVDLDRALDISPDDVWALRCRAKVLTIRRDHVQALADMDRAVEVAPEWHLVAHERGEALRLAGRAVDSLADYDRAIALDGEDVGAYTGRGAALNVLGRHDEALADCDRAIELDGDYAAAYAARGAALASLGRHDEALADWDRAIELDPANVFALHRRSMVHRELSHYDRAFADADQANGLLPDNVAILYERGAALSHLGRNEEARTDLDRVLELGPEDQQALAVRGDLLCELGCYEQALADLCRAIEINSEFAWAIARRAWAFAVTGRSQQALADLARYAQIGENPGWAHRKTAQIHLWLGCADRALTAMSADEVAGNAFSAVVLAKAYRMTGQWDLSREAVRTLRESQEVVGAALYALAVSGSEGLGGARPLWEEAARSIRAVDPPLALRSPLPAVIDAALGNWEALDARLSRVLAAGVPEVEWDDLAEHADLLTEVLRAPGADRSRLAPRLARVVAARDAFQARYAEAVIESTEGTPPRT